MSATVKLVITIHTLPGLGEEQVEAFQKVAPTVRAEEGCIQYDLFRVSGDPNRFIVLEEWESKDALIAHMGAAHMAEYGKAVAAFRSGPVEAAQLDAL